MGILVAPGVGVLVVVRLGPGVKDGVNVGLLEVWMTSWGALAPSRLEKLMLVLPHSAWVLRYLHRHTSTGEHPTETGAVVSEFSP